jgi:hypothetical protein
MPFPIVKSDPWMKGVRRRRKHALWPDRFWKQLVEQAKRDAPCLFSDECFRMIAEMNFLLYGRKP